MKKMMCSRCGKRPAMFFITKVEGNETKQEGLCMKCAMEMNIGPIKQIMESMVESFILKHWQMVKKLYLFQKIMDTKQRWDMYLSAGPGTQSPINRTVNIRSAAQTVILSFIR